MRSRRRVLAQLEQRTDELESEREAFARLAAQRERARIARELHDIISHNMAVMVVQAGAGRIAPPEDPQRVADIFRGIRAAGGAALAEMDQLVDVLGRHSHTSAAANALTGVPDLIARARSAGLDITAALSVKDSDVPIEVEQAAYRAIQEGLTNVLKHAPASHVQLRLQARERQLEIEVHNTGSPGDGAGTRRDRLAPRTSRYAGADSGSRRRPLRRPAARRRLALSRATARSSWRLTVSGRAYIAGMTRTSSPRATTRPSPSELT